MIVDITVQILQLTEQLLKFILFAYRYHCDHCIHQLRQEKQKWYHCRRKPNAYYGTTKQNHLFQFSASSEMNIDEIHQMSKVSKTDIKSS